MYREHRPPSAKMDHDSFYLTPILDPRGEVWYKTTPIGVNTLSKTVNRLCVKGGVGGYKSNHSLRVTAATRLFHNGIDEQLIMERTGHRSSDGVRAYKRTCPKQHEELSDVLQGVPSSKKPKRDVANANSENATATDSKVASRPTCSMTVEAAVNCCQKNSMCPLLNITNCRGITVNYHLKP